MPRAYNLRRFPLRVDARRPIVPTELIEAIAENLGKELIATNPENSQWGTLHKTLVNISFTNRYIARKTRKFLFHTINLTNLPTGRNIRHFNKYKRVLQTLAWVLSPQNPKCPAPLVKKLALCFVPDARYLMDEDCAYDWLISLWKMLPHIVSNLRGLESFYLSGDLDLDDAAFLSSFPKKTYAAILRLTAGNPLQELYVSWLYIPLCMFVNLPPTLRRLRLQAVGLDNMEPFHHDQGVPLRACPSYIEYDLRSGLGPQFAAIPGGSLYANLTKLQYSIRADDFGESLLTLPPILFHSARTLSHVVINFIIRNASDLSAAIGATAKIGIIFPQRDRFRLEGLKQLDIKLEDARRYGEAAQSSCCNNLWVQLAFRMLEWPCWKRATTLGVSMWWTYKADAYHHHLPTQFVDVAAWHPFDASLAQRVVLPSLRVLELSLTGVCRTPKGDIWCDENDFIRSATRYQGRQAFTRTVLAGRCQVIVDTDS